MNMRDTLKKIDEEMQDAVVQQFAPKNRPPIPIAAMVPKRSPEEVARELRGVFDEANAAGAINSPISHALKSADGAPTPPNFGERAAEQINESAEHAFKDISHAIEMLSAMREALARDAAALSARIKEFTRISAAISSALKEFTATATNGGSHVKETPKG